MEFIIYLTFFIIGTLFGSFFTLAVYRIPLGKDITHERSFCPNCNHKLQFLDLIPVLSYIFLRAKFRYCGNKIRPRYLILEIATGLIFAIYAYSFKIDWLHGFDFKIVLLVLGLLYFTALLIIAGIDRERKQIEKSVLIYLLIINMLYIIYTCTFEKINVYGYVIYLIAMALITLMDIYIIRKKLYSSYILQVLILFLNIVIFSGTTITYFTVISTLIWIALNCTVKIIKQKINKTKQVNDKIDLNMGYYLSISNIILVIISNFLIYR